MSQLVDKDALLADLAAWWAGNPGARRIAGSEWDWEIPEGVSNPYWEIVRQLPEEPLGLGLPWHVRPEPSLYWLSGGRTEHRVFADRFDMCATYSWAICSPGDIGWLQDTLDGQGVVEAGAGTGYWAWQMTQAGIDVVAYDPNEQLPGNRFARRTWTTVLRDDYAASKHHPDRALFLSWPSYDEPWAAQSLACYTGNMLIYCGEGEGGCTANDEFFELLDAEWEVIGDSPAHVAYWGIHDYMTAYGRKR